jgi:hypothetical protein
MTFLTRWIAGTAAIDAQTFEIKVKEPFFGVCCAFSATAAPASSVRPRWRLTRAMRWA